MHWLAVALGGALGAMGRYAVAQWIPLIPGKFPLATFTVNVTGSFLMGACFVLIVEKALLPPYAKQIVMIGFLGALTTFSTFAMDALHLMYSGHWKLALSYVICSVFACIFAAFSAYVVFNKLI